MPSPDNFDEHRSGQTAVHLCVDDVPPMNKSEYASGAFDGVGRGMDEEMDKEEDDLDDRRTPKSAKIEGREAMLDQPANHATETLLPGRRVVLSLFLALL